MVSKPYSGLRSACVWQQTRHTIIIPASNKEPSTYHFILHPPLLWLIDLPASISLFLLLDKKEKQIRRKQSWYRRNPVNPSANQMGKKLGYHLHQSHGGVYIFLIEGEIVVDGEVLKRRDGMGVYDTKSFELETLKDSHILLIEVPM